MSNADIPEPTLAYTSALPFFLSQLPALSSHASHQLTSLLPPEQLSKSLLTKCHRCRVEIIGGVNGSFCTAYGSLWARCDGCGWTTRRGDKKEWAEAEISRKKFLAVKKRKLDNKTVIKTGTETCPAPPIPVATNQPEVVTPLPIPSLFVNLPQSSAAKSPPLPLPSASSSTPINSSTPQKRKRSKQNAGLAELLEAKRRQKSAEGTGVGLKDFLSNM